MRITTKGRYALRAVVALARLSDGSSPVSIKTIGGEEGLSAEFLEQIFFRLKKAGIIRSIRGPGGGFVFAKPLSAILLKDIVMASGEGVDLATCSGDGDEERCDRVDRCAAGRVWGNCQTISTRTSRASAWSRSWHRTAGKPRPSPDSLLAVDERLEPLPLRVVYQAHIAAERYEFPDVHERA
ncbi:MAG TPA: Rrf2 family transcriptional regulator [Spirochaetales bacterium]|nr:Rrf2 family transcriptional regulator [Spirochaetales bacterium]